MQQKFCCIEVINRWEKYTSTKDSSPNANDNQCQAAQEWFSRKLRKVQITIMTANARTRLAALRAFTFTSASTTYISRADALQQLTSVDSSLGHEAIALLEQERTVFDHIINPAQYDAWL